MTPHKSLIALTALALLSGCGDKAQDAANQIKENAAELRIRETWVGPCGNVKLDLFGLSSRVESYEIGGSLNRTTTFFKEDGCTTPSVRVVEGGSYNLGDPVADQVHVFDANYTSVAVTPLTDEGRDALNLVNFCGVKDWATGQTRDVTPATSDNPVLSRCWAKTPRQVFDLVKVTEDQLKLGLEKDGRDKTAADKRPTEVDEGVVFSKQ